MHSHCYLQGKCVFDGSRLNMPCTHSLDEINGKNECHKRNMECSFGLDSNIIDESCQCTRYFLYSRTRDHWETISSCTFILKTEMSRKEYIYWEIWCWCPGRTGWYSFIYFPLWPAISNNNTLSIHCAWSDTEKVKMQLDTLMWIKSYNSELIHW